MLVEPPAEEDKGKSLWLSLLAYGLLVVLALLDQPDPAGGQLPFAGEIHSELPRTGNQHWVGSPLRGAAGRSTFSGTPARSCSILPLSPTLFTAKLATSRRAHSKAILGRVVKSGVNSSLGIVAMVGLASIMLHSGMTYLLAEGLSVGFGPKGFPTRVTIHRRAWEPS